MPLIHTRLVYSSFELHPGRLFAVWHPFSTPTAESSQRTLRGFKPRLGRWLATFGMPLGELHPNRDAARRNHQHTARHIPANAKRPGLR